MTHDTDLVVRFADCHKKYLHCIYQNMVIFKHSKNEAEHVYWDNSEAYLVCFSKRDRHDN